MKALKAKGGQRKLAMLALPLAVALIAGSLYACSPSASAASSEKKTPVAEASQDAAATTTVSGYPNFLENSAGIPTCSRLWT